MNQTPHSSLPRRAAAARSARRTVCTVLAAAALAAGCAWSSEDKREPVSARVDIPVL